MARARILFRRDTTADWNSNNPVLSAGEPAVDLTTGVFKIGDGVTAWTSLPAVSGGGGGLDVEGVEDAVGAMFARSSHVGLTAVYNDAAATLTLTVTGGGTTDPEVVRDTIAAALRVGSGLQLVVDDAGDTITINVSGIAVSQVTGLQAALDGKMALKNNPETTLAPSADSIGGWSLASDGSSSASWPNRLFVAFTGSGSAPSGWAARHLVQWWNEYGEWRGMPALFNTVGWRLFAADSPTAYGTRDATVPVAEIASDRTDRTRLWGVFKDGTAYLAGRLTAPNVDDRVSTYPTGSVPADGSAELLAMPDGSLIVEYTP